MQTDLVSPLLRSVERDIDSAYMANPLVRRTFGESAWYFLAFCEERLLLPLIKGLDATEPLNLHEQAALADEVINHAKWPLRWLRQSCPLGEIVPRGYSEETYKASWELSQLASDYLSFESAFTYASLGLVTLRLEGNRIIPSGPLRDDTRFEAYDRLADLEEKGNPVDLTFIAELVGNNILVDGDRFSYPLNPKIVQETLRGVDSELSRRFRLPIDWNLSAYSLGEYATVAKCLWVISAVHMVSRLRAAAQGCLGLGYSQALVLMGNDELTRRLTRYTGLPETSIQSVIADLTYGGNTIKSPDPALQPLLCLTGSTVGWAPGLFLNNSLERNLMVFLNRTASTRSTYTRLSQQKEDLLRSRIKSELDKLDVRFWSGDVTGWYETLDIDFAIISDSEKQCLLLELKSFIAPAEPREVRDRSEEIARGIQQICTRRMCAERQPQALRNALKVSDDYDLAWAVVSETSIGGAWIQDDSVPVVRVAHLVRKLRETRRLRPVCDWLKHREYLPVNGKDYEAITVTQKINQWELEWWGIKGLW